MSAFGGFKEIKNFSIDNSDVYWLSSALVLG